MSECTVTHMAHKLSTSEERRPIVLSAAITAFARGGYRGTTVADVATQAAISPAYVFKLFPGKEALFVAALDSCFEQIVTALDRGRDAAPSQTPDAILDAMGAAYAELIADRDLLMLQVHAQSAADVPEIASALRRGFARVTEFASSRSGASDAAVQRFVAFGQLCHLVVTLNIDDASEPWAKLLSAGLDHPSLTAATASTLT